jgi:hypothetical protein
MTKARNNKRIKKPRGIAHITEKKTKRMYENGKQSTTQQNT